MEQPELIVPLNDENVMQRFKELRLPDPTSDLWNAELGKSLDQFFKGGMLVVLDIGSDRVFVHTR